MDDDELVSSRWKRADGYLLKRTKPEDLRTALLDALSGGVPIRADRASRGDLPPAHSRRRRSPDDAREEVLVMLSKGYSNGDRRLDRAERPRGAVI